jgi:hypothetical protein
VKRKKSVKKNGNTAFIVMALLFSIAIAFFISPLASSHPDGLEWVAEKLGFIDRGDVAVWEASPMPDYTLFGDSVPSGMLAGLLGTIIVFFLGWLMGVVVRKRRSQA